MPKQVRFIQQSTLNDGQDIAEVAVFDTSGNPVSVGETKQGVAVADAAGSTPTQAEFNALLASLRTAGIIAS